MPTAADYRFTELDNGTQIVTELMPAAQTASLGLWIKSGSRRESPDMEGAAHFWEHLAFKGTTSRSTHDIALDLDILGGLSNAFTGRENTCFHIRTAAKHFRQAFEITSDVALNPRPPREELEREKEVVLQEISMVEDAPEDKIHEAVWESLWDEPSLAHSILGRPQSVTAFRKKNLDAWRHAHYRPSNLLIAAAGAVNHDELVAMARAALADTPAGPPPPPPSPAAYLPGQTTIARDVEQTHALLSFPAVSNRDPRRFAQTILSTILGGNMSSRLFQEIREKRGLAYSIYSMVNGLSDVGTMQIYAAVDPERARELLDVLAAELDRILAKGVSDREMAHTREHLQGLLYLSSESIENRMMRLARNHLLFGRHVPLEETAAELEKPTAEDVAALAAELLAPQTRGLGLLGPNPDPEWIRIIRP